MTDTPLLRYGSLSIYDGKHVIYMMHANCDFVLCAWPKKSSPIQVMTKRGLLHMKGNINCVRCVKCKQGIPNKAFEFLDKTAKLLAQ